MSMTILQVMNIIATAVGTYVIIFGCWEIVLAYLRRRRERHDEANKVIIYEGLPSSAEEFAQAFRVELGFGCEFYRHLHGAILKRNRKCGAAQRKETDLRGFKELRRDPAIKALRENIHRRVAIQFERHLLNAYLDESGVHHTYDGCYFFGSAVPHSPLTADHGHADAGAVAEDVHEERGETNDQREDGDHGGN